METGKLSAVIAEKTNRPIRIIQITDSHLSERRDARFRGVKPYETLLAVVELMQRQEARIDCVLCTGDIAQDASVAAYRHFHGIISTLKVPHLWLPGNHDLPANMRRALGADSPCLRRTEQFGQWKIIMLNSRVAGQDHGHLAESELEALAAEAGEDAEEARNGEGKTFALACLHHQPVPVADPGFRDIALRNPKEFFAVLDQCSRIRGVLFGHIHRRLERVRNGVRILGSPATSVEFRPRGEECPSAELNPAYRWLELHADGSIRSGVERI